jgi:hypothetical protein
MQDEAEAAVSAETTPFVSLQQSVSALRQGSVRSSI